MLQRITRSALANPWRIVFAAVLIVAAAAVFGIPVITSLSSGGFQDPTSQSWRASQLLADKFGVGDMQLKESTAKSERSSSSTYRAEAEPGSTRPSDLADPRILAGITKDARGQCRIRRVSYGPHWPRGDGRSVADGGHVRLAHGRESVDHVHVRCGGPVSGPDGRHAGSDAAGAGIHAGTRPAELVGAKTSRAATSAFRHLRVG